MPDVSSAAGKRGSAAGVPSEATSRPPAVRMVSISKSFGSTVACDGVDLTLRRGRIHGLLGENGAGKSTLMNILMGLVLPDRGAIEISGRRRRIRNAQDAAGHGLAMVHQSLSLIGAFTVWENVALGRSGRFDPDSARRRVAQISERFGLDVDPDALAAALPAGMRQRVEIIKCLQRDPRVLILDEPTSALSEAESRGLFRVLRNVVRTESRAVVFASHDLGEVLAAADDVTVMREGAVVARLEASETDAPSLARVMLGRDFSPAARAAEPSGREAHSAAAVFRVRDVALRGPRGRRLLDGLSFDVSASEIVCIAGLQEEGQEALVDVLSSLSPVESGVVEAAGEAVAIGRPGAMARAGVAVIPADRGDSASVRDMSVAENLFLADMNRFASRGVYDPAETRREARRLIAEFEIEPPEPDAPFWSLSGGNQQRVVLARELSGQPAVLVAARPFRGLDVGAVEWMTQRLRETARRGVGVLLVSNDPREILRLADRVLVMSDGRIVSETSCAGLDEAAVATLISGGSTSEAG